MKTYVEATVKISIEVGENNFPIEDYSNLLVWLPKDDIPFPLIDDGVSVAGKIIRCQTLGVRKI